MSEIAAAQQLQQMADLLMPMCLRVAATLRIADHIAAGVTTLPVLAERCGAQIDALQRLLRHLVTAGVLSMDPGGEYRLTDLGRGLQSDNLASVRAAIDIDGAIGRADLACLRLLDTVRTGQPAYPLVYGKSFWEDLAADAGLRASFDEAMAAHDTAPIVAGYPWNTLAWVVDVGGGNGSLLVALLTAYPGLRGTLVELGAPAERARHLFSDSGLAGRTAVVTASFFDPLPKGADAYLVCNVIADWNDAGAIRILHRCAEAAGSSGRILVVQGVLRHDETDATASDLSMFLLMGGRARTLDEFAGLAAAAGLAMTEVRDLGGRYLLAFTPAAPPRQL